MSSLQALGSLLARRLSPRAQAQAPGTRGSAAGRPARFLHSWRSLVVGGAAVAAAATSSGFAFLHLKKDADESAGQAIGEKARTKEVTDKKPGNAEEVIIISDEAFDDRKAGHEATGSEPLKEQRDMEAEFEDWMKKYNKKYRDEEEKAMRFQLFKARVEFIDSHYPPSVGKTKISFFPDFTPQERGRLRGVSPPDEEFYQFLKSRPEFINCHKGLAEKA